MRKLVSWVEIPSKNFERAIKFYKSVFRIKLQEHYFEDEKMACFENDEGAIIHSSNFVPSENGVLISLMVPDNIEKTILRVLEHSGKVIQGEKKIQREQGGSFAIILDSEGNQIGLFEER